MDLKKITNDPKALTKESKQIHSKIRNLFETTGVRTFKFQFNSTRREVKPIESAGRLNVWPFAKHCLWIIFFILRRRKFFVSFTGISKRILLKIFCDVAKRANIAFVSLKCFNLKCLRKSVILFGKSTEQPSHLEKRGPFWEEWVEIKTYKRKLKNAWILVYST